MTVWATALAWIAGLPMADLAPRRGNDPRAVLYDGPLKEDKAGGGKCKWVRSPVDARSSLDEVSAAVGHSSPVVTRRYYDHFVRRSFSATLRAGLTLSSPDRPPVAMVIPIRAARSAR